jgi:hypothetical protein
LAFSVKLRELPFRLAVSRADVVVVIAATVAVKVRLVWPRAMLTPLGTVMLVLLLDSATVNASVSTGADSVTVQVVVAGAVTVPGEQLRLLGTTVTVRLTLADWLWPFSVAVMVAVALPVELAPTVPLVAANVALLWPGATVTLAGTAKVALLLASVMVAALEAA